MMMRVKKLYRNNNEGYSRMIRKHYTTGAEQQYKEIKTTKRLHRKKNEGLL
jgi:hypothetical protein